MSQHTEDQVEEFESIPWDALLQEEAPDRRRWMIVAAVALAALALSASAARSLWPASPASTPASPATSTTAGTVRPSTSSTTVAGSESSLLLTEADLLAVDLGELEREAAALASWYLHDLLTREGGSGGGRSFVEIVEVTEVRHLADARYAVVLLARTLSDGGDGYRRVPPRATEVIVDLDEGAVVDLPRPLPAPSVTVLEQELPSGQPPTSVMEAAIQAAEEWGEVDAAAIEAGTDGERWRLVVPVSDAAGLVWHVAVWTDHEGQVTPAGG